MRWFLLLFPLLCLVVVSVAAFSPLIPGLDSFAYLKGRQVSPGSKVCRTDREDEFYPFNLGNFTPNVRVSSLGVNPLLANASLLEQASKYIFAAIKAPIVSKPLVPSKLGQLVLTGLYICADRPDAFIFAVSAGETVGNASKKVLLDVRADYHAQEAWLTMKLSRIVLSGPFVTLEEVSTSTTYAPADAKVMDSEVSVSLQEVPSSSDFENFGAAFFLIELKVAIQQFLDGISTRYNLRVQLLEDVDAVCGPSGSFWLSSAAPGRVVLPFDVPISSVAFARRTEVTVCSIDQYNFPTEFPSPQSNEPLTIYSLPQYPLQGDVFRFGDADLRLDLNGSEINRMDYANGMGEKISVSTPHATASPAFYSAQVATLGVGGYTPLSYIFAFTRCNAPFSPPSVLLSADSSNDWLLTPVVTNLTLCGTQARFDINVTDFHSATELSPRGIWIDVQQTLWSETDAGSPELRVDVLDAAGNVIATRRSFALWHRQRLAVQRSFLLNATVLRGSISRQKYYPSSLFGSPLQPQSPLVQVITSSSTVRAVDAGSCPTISTPAPSTLSLTLCGGSVSIVQIPGLSPSEQGQAATTTGYDLVINVQLVGAVDDSIPLEEIEISIKTLIPAISSFWGGTGYISFRNSFQIRVPSSILLPGLPTASTGLMTEMQMKNPYGVPVNISIDVKWYTCTEDGRQNGLVQYKLTGGSSMPNLPLNDSGVLAIPPVSAWVCRGEFDYWKVLLSPEVEILQIDIELFSFGTRYNSTDGSVFANADQVALRVLSPGGNELLGDIDIAATRYNGRSSKFDLRQLSAAPGEVYLELSSNGAARANYTLSLRWRKAFTTVGGIPLIANRTFPTGGLTATTLMGATTAGTTIVQTSTSRSASAVAAETSSAVGVGIIALIVVIAVLAVVAVLVGMFLARRRNRRKQTLTPVAASYNSDYAHMTYPLGNKSPAETEMSSVFTSSARKLEDVRIEALIGQGNFGSVWKASWHGTPVAAKTVDSVREIEGELSVLLKIDHPNCVHFLGITRTKPPDEVRERDYMVFELAEASVLSLLQGGERLPVIRKLEMLRDAARGVNYLGGLGIVHRDLACRNLLYDRNRTLLSDFGLSRKYDGEFYATTVEGAKAAMPIRWTAPEILKQGKATTASDCYSFAVLIWEMFEDGNVPFGGVSNADVMRIAGEGRVADVLRQPSELPDVLYDMMKRMWAPEPSARPPFAVVLELLESICAGGREPTPTLSGYSSQAGTTLNTPSYTPFAGVTGPASAASNSPWLAVSHSPSREVRNSTSYGAMEAYVAPRSPG